MSNGLAVCPDCGADLKQFAPVSIGGLDLEQHEVRWRGKAVCLSASQQRLVRAVARANGRAVAIWALADVLGVKEDSVSRRDVVQVQLCRVRRAFREIDPGFDSLETVIGVGVRWRGQAEPCRD